MTTNTPVFHPSIFEDRSKDAAQRDDTMVLDLGDAIDPNINFDEKVPRASQDPDSLKAHRELDLKSIQNKGKFAKTVGRQLSRSNTRAVFKNMHGDTLLTNLFFSEANISNIQKLVRLQVYQKMEMVIDDQSIDELLIIMRSVYIQFAAHPPLLDASQPREIQEKIIQKNVEQVDQLNKRVVNEIVPMVVSGIKQHLAYLRDASQPPQHMDKPVNDSIRGQRELRSVTSVLTGIL
jgi:hypothetical protein